MAQCLFLGRATAPSLWLIPGGSWGAPSGVRQCWSSRWSWDVSILSGSWEPQRGMSGVTADVGHVLGPTSCAWFVLPIASHVVESFLFIAEDSHQVFSFLTIWSSSDLSSGFILMWMIIAAVCSVLHMPHFPESSHSHVFIEQMRKLKPKEVKCTGKSSGLKIRD